tara:strand:+ start:367 stop:648 length:282 start_codon:yes stop_codon:yes gene_type:complete
MDNFSKAKLADGLIFVGIPVLILLCIISLYKIHPLLFVIYAMIGLYLTTLYDKRLFVKYKEKSYIDHILYVIFQILIAPIGMKIRIENYFDNM